jgi:hypothetical protein
MAGPDVALHRPGRYALAVLALGAAAALAGSGTDLRIGDFQQGLEGWQQREFNGATSYRLVTLDDEQVLEAHADGTAAALYHEARIDPAQTPWLSWRWRVESTFGPETDERQKSGDDYPARIYVVRSGGWAWWRTRALNYVWASGQPEGARWPSAYAGDNVQLIALDSGTGRAGEWVRHTRDLRADWRAAFGEDLDRLDGVALMTDADDTGGSVRAWYADIRLSSAP